MKPALAAQEVLSVQAGACLLHSSAAGKVQTETSIVPAKGINETSLRKEVAQHRARHGSSDLSWKVVGVGQAAADAAAALKGLGEKIEKVVERPTAFQALHLKSVGRLRISVEEASSSPRPAPEAGLKRLKVLVVDDSSSIRNLLKKMVEEETDLEVVATAERPSQVESLIQQHKPDVITLDIHMPEEDGVSLLKRLFPKYKIPTIMVTAISLQEGRKVFEALESGAVDYVQKPDFAQIRAMGSLLREKIRMASKARHVSFTASAPARPTFRQGQIDQSGMIVIGSSTGGTEALKAVLLGLPKEIPPILIVQHIPPVFSKAFADRMNQLCPFEVLEGNEGGMEVLPGRVIVAAGGTQMGVKKVGGGYRITVDPGADPVNRHKPSVDYLFSSIKDQAFAGKRLGVILTGMGADGARGMKELKDRGWHTIAQDEATSVVFGMPKEAIRMGGVDDVLPLPAISGRLLSLLQK